jgi:hypothetical protein
MGTSSKLEVARAMSTLQRWCRQSRSCAHFGCSTMQPTWQPTQVFKASQSMQGTAPATVCGDRNHGEAVGGWHKPR